MDRSWSKADYQSIRDACREVASNQAERRGLGQLIDVAAIDALTERLFKVALDAVQCSHVAEPDVAVRAIRYLARTHAIPPMGENTFWLFIALSVLFELACPSWDQGHATDAFFRDIERGIADSRARFDD